MIDVIMIYDMIMIILEFFIMIDIMNIGVVVD